MRHGVDPGDGEGAGSVISVEAQRSRSDGRRLHRRERGADPRRRGAPHRRSLPSASPVVCGARNLGEALRRVGEGAALIRSEGRSRHRQHRRGGASHAGSVTGGIKRADRSCDPRSSMARVEGTAGAPLRRWCEWVAERRRSCRCPSSPPVASPPPADAVAGACQLGARGGVRGQRHLQERRPGRPRARRRPRHHPLAGPGRGARRVPRSRQRDARHRDGDARRERAPREPGLGSTPASARRPAHSEAKPSGVERDGFPRPRLRGAVEPVPHPPSPAKESVLEAPHRHPRDPGRRRGPRARARARGRRRRRGEGGEGARRGRRPDPPGRREHHDLEGPRATRALRAARGVRPIGTADARHLCRRDPARPRGGEPPGAQPRPPRRGGGAQRLRHPGRLLRRPGRGRTLDRDAVRLHPGASPREGRRRRRGARLARRRPGRRAAGERLGDDLPPRAHRRSARPPRAGRRLCLC